MKKKSISQSGFFNLRVLIGLVVVLAGVFLALLGFGAFSAQAQQQKYNVTTKTDPLVPALFDCSKIQQLGIDKQENMRAGAIMIFCGAAQGGSGSFVEKLLAPLVYGTTDVNLITGTETSPNITQSETFAQGNPDNPLQIVVAYNDSRGRNVVPINISGASVSTDGGNTFTRLTAANGQSPFTNTLGDPVILYNRPTGTWFTIWLDAGCGDQGLGGYKSTTPEDPNSWTHYCVHTGSNDDRESGWVDNNPSSPFYGRMYVSWNDFARGQGIFVRYSTDNGLTWTNERQITATFFRNVQITGDLATGDVYIAAMDEMGGGLTNRANRIYRSTDGGNTWSNTYVGPTFPGPGRGSSGFFATMYNSPVYWRHQGWGQPAALNGVVNYVYAARDTGNGDPGNVFHIRSTDHGVSFSAPFMLNTNTDPTKAQWQPNLSVAADGSLLAVWYDERERVAASCQPSSPSTPCYRMWARKSTDNGATWLPDMEFSDAVTPLPLQPDPGIIAIYAGDYDYGSSLLTQHLSAWVDGRVTVSGNSQQDAFHDRDPISAVGLVVVSTEPACGSVMSTQPTDFFVSVNDPVDPATLQASDFLVNGTPGDSVAYTPGTTTMTFHFSATPVINEGEQTMNIPAGAFNRASDDSPVFEFACTFRYDATLLQVTNTVPPAGGTFTPPAPNDYTYDVNWNEPVDPNSVQTSDLQVSGDSEPTVTNVQLINGNTTARFTLHMNFGGSLTASIAAGVITDTFGNPNAAFSGNYTVEGIVCSPAEWNLAVVDPNVIDADSYVTSTAIFFDSLNRPNFVYARGPARGDRWSFKWSVLTPNGFRTRQLPARQASPQLSVASDSQDRIHLCWRSGGFFGQGILSYGKLEGGRWHEEIVDPQLGSTSYCSIAVDANDNPHIIYTPELVNRPMRYAHWNGTAWVIEDVIVQSGLLSPSLAMDSVGEPHVVYTSGRGTEVDYAVRSGGTWSFETIAVIPGDQQALATSLVLDPLGQPHVAYDQHFAVGIRYATRTEAGWTTTLIDSGQHWDPSIALDSHGAPHIAYYHAENGALRYASLVAGSWCRQLVDDDPSELVRIGRNAGLVLDRDGRAHISYHSHDQNEPCEVKYAVSITPRPTPHHGHARLRFHARLRSGQKDL
jgi:hypothetical protein